MHLEVLMQLLQPYAGVLFGLCFLWLILPALKHEAVQALRIFFWWGVLQYIGTERIRYGVEQAVQYVLKETAPGGRASSRATWWGR